MLANHNRPNDVAGATIATVLYYRQTPAGKEGQMSAIKSAATYMMQQKEKIELTRTDSP
jgi:hypothetical protein